MDSEQSVSAWIEQLKAGDNEAAKRLWERYFAQLVQVAYQKLRGIRHAAADEEDIALSAFFSFCQAARQGRVESLQNREDLWHLLLFFTKCKAVGWLRREASQRRGGGKEGQPSAQIITEENSLDELISREPNPEFAAILQEEFDALLNQLPDEEMQTIALFKLEGYTNAEVAKMIPCSLRTVERRLDIIRKVWSGAIAALS